MTECAQETGYLQSINYDKQLPQSPFTGQYFQMRTFCYAYESYLSTVRQKRKKNGAICRLYLLRDK
jgi:hypothetical protein